jgi:hypothetical protein
MIWRCCAKALRPHLGVSQDYCEQRYRERVLRALSQRAAKLGMQRVPIAQPA